MRAFLRVLCVMVLAASFFSGCTDRADDSIRIGAVGPMTGAQSKMGIDLRNAVELAVSEWNEKGGVLGKKIVVMAEDDQADPKQAVAVANKLVHRHVAGVVGHWNSSCSIPASKNYHDAGIVMISPATTNPRLTQQGFRNVFRVCGTDDQQGRVAAAFVRKQKRFSRVAIIHDKTAYGQGLADYFKDALDGAVNVVYYGYIAQGDADYKAVLASIKDSRADLYFFGGIYPEAGRLVRQAKEIGLDIPMMTGDGVFDPTFINIAARAAEGTYVTFGKDPVGLSTAKDFLKKYEARYGDAGPYSIYAYDAANIILTAIERTGSLNGEELSRFIAKGSFPGAFGEIGFDERGDVKKAPYVVWEVRGGAFVQVPEN